MSIDKWVFEMRHLASIFNCRSSSFFNAVAWLLLAGALPQFAAASETLKKIQENRTVVLAFMGVVDNLSPFVLIEPDGEVSGYSIDICLKIVQGIKREMKLPNIKIQFIPVNTSTRFSALLDNRADLECSVSTNNADRRKNFSFTIPHFFTSVRMLVHVNSGIKDWSDLRNKRIVTTKGTAMSDVINKRSNIAGLGLAITELESDQECVRMLEQGLADAFVMDEILLYGARASAGNPDKLVIAGTSLSVEPYAIMLRKGDPEFKKMVDKQMAKLVASGEILRLYNRWFMQPIGPERRMLNMPMSYILRDSLRYPTDKITN
ncbi:periplasmic component of amino acid ABC-type transporter/signal transduction system [Herbaspirillum sp. CF444]|uniref:amino acid ABC transporter substrate-binding protein n=1 Tax=Herbaspirillum sp. CF444 TaxID=1144319 RepID=UPI0002725D97|nr:amino acid ABC transporter substrate-binding protein [Herbaspirillum sp. CF444]EJL88930.1 periplasmic component of amino acid ABC-type transporter/signal transduction system [Herbaspirillum sp. CF444]